METWITCGQVFGLVACVEPIQATKAKRKSPFAILALVFELVSLFRLGLRFLFLPLSREELGKHFLTGFLVRICR